MRLFGKKTRSEGGSTPSNRRRYVVAGISVLGLAIVIAVVAAIGPGRSDTGVTLPNVRFNSDQTYDQAVKAAQSGDTTAAKVLARKAVSADPSNEKARQLVSRLDRSAAPTLTGNSSNNGGGGSHEGTSTSPDTGFTTHISDLTPLLPTAFDGFSLDPVAKTDTDVSVSARAKSAAMPASHVVWAIHDMGTPAAAKGFLTHTSRNLYPSHPATVNVDGVQGYFGSDGSRFATVAYVRGRYVFEVLLSATGPDPDALQSLTVSAAQRFGDSRPQ